MSALERGKRLDDLRAAFAKPGGAQALRFVLNTLSAIPVAGGAIAGAGSLWAEREQTASNNTLLDWALLADAEIAQISDSLQRLVAEPSKVSMSLLLGEVLGEQAYSALLDNDDASIPVVLHPSTVTELEPYISKQWLGLLPTGAVCSMGANNRVGNHIEELKRPFGLGSGFVLSLTSLGRAVD